VVKELSENLKSVVNNIKSQTENMPKYVPNRTGFFCPISPQILWHHNLRYKECPIVSSERDMLECMKCINKGDSNAKYRKRKTSRNRKNIPKTERRKTQELIPKIGKTYTSK
jgi:hypothetical protein